MASRQISIEKQVALKTLIDELLDKEVIRPSMPTAWSYAGSYANMKDMVGSLKPRVFEVVDLTQGFYQMPLHKDCWAATAFISFRGIFEWTRVPRDLTDPCTEHAKYIQICCSMDRMTRISSSTRGKFSRSVREKASS